VDELERLLPAWIADVVEPGDIHERARLLSVALVEPAPYLAYEDERDCFAWLTLPASEAAATAHMPGPTHWFLLLRRRRSGWRVEKAIPCGSLEGARMAAGMEWAGRAGYLIEYRDGQPVLGPHISDFEDPARYLDAARQARKRER